MLNTRIAGLSLAASLLAVSGCGHPGFENRWSSEESPGPRQQPVVTDSEGPSYQPGTPSWVPLIDECMRAGGSRGECIAALPPEELARLEAWEAEQGARRRSQMALRRTLNTPAETRAFGVFRIDLPPGWLARTEPPGEAGRQDRIVVAHPAGIGALRLATIIAPEPVTHDQLRNLTNVDAAVAMQTGQWGDYQGYQYDYLEDDQFFRQWWLARDDVIVLVTYQCPSGFKDVEKEQINEVVGSLRAAAR